MERLGPFRRTGEINLEWCVPSCPSASGRWQLSPSTDANRPGACIVSIQSVLAYPGVRLCRYCHGNPLRSVMRGSFSICLAGRCDTLNQGYGTCPTLGVDVKRYGSTSVSPGDFGDASAFLLWLRLAPSNTVHRACGGTIRLSRTLDLWLSCPWSSASHPPYDSRFECWGARSPRGE